MLSDALLAVRRGRPHSKRHDLSGRWELPFPATPAAGFHIVLHGAAWIRLDGQPAVHLGPGDVVFLPHGDGHTLTDSENPQSSVGPGRTALLCGAYVMDRARPHPLIEELPPLVHISATIGRHGPLRTAVDLLAAELDQPRPGGAAVLASTLDMLLIFILRTWYESTTTLETGARWGIAIADPAVAAALNAMHAQPAEPWTVATLAAHSGLSRAAFARRFNELVGRPPLAYLSWWRMTLAGRDLQTRDAPLSAIARRVGYASEFAFGKAFKRDYGVSPGSYRRSACP